MTFFTRADDRGAELRRRCDVNSMGASQTSEIVVQKSYPQSSVAVPRRHRECEAAKKQKSIRHSCAFHASHNSGSSENTVLCCLTRQALEPR